MSDPDSCLRMIGRGVAEHGEVALEVGGDHGVELVLGHVEQHPLAQDAGHRHHAVDAAPPLDGGVHDALAPGHGAHVLGDGHRFAAGALDLLHHGLGDLAGGVLTGQPHADVGHDDLGALGRARQRAGPADAAAPARDHDRLVRRGTQPRRLPLPVSSGPKSDGMLDGGAVDSPADAEQQR